MRQLLNTLFVTSEDIYLSLDGGNVVASRTGETVARYPLHTLQSIVSFSYSGASPALMGECAKRGDRARVLLAAREISRPRRGTGTGKRPAAADAVPCGGRSGTKLPHRQNDDLRQGL